MILDMLFWVGIVVFSVYAIFWGGSTVVYFTGRGKLKIPLFKSLSNPPRVVVMIPVKDDPPALETVTLLKKSSYPNMEIAIIDDSTNADFRAKIDSLGVSVIRREDNLGWKGGALENALKHYESNPPKYVIFFDADFLVPSNFVERAVNTAERNPGYIIQGYQAHPRGAAAVWFGRLYQASAGAALVILGTRTIIKAAPIFTGSCACIPFELLRQIGMDDCSITEDWSFTLRTLIQRGTSVKMYSDLVAYGAVPESWSFLVKQQLRWATGTLRDFLKYISPLYKSRIISLREKVVLTIHALSPLNGLVFLANIPLYIYYSIHGGCPITSQQSLFISIFFGVAYGSLLLGGCLVERISPRYYPQVLVLGFLSLIPFSIIQIVSIKRALLKQGSWVVTKRSCNYVNPNTENLQHDTQ